MQRPFCTRKTNKNGEMYTLSLWKAACGGTDLGYNNICSELGSGNVLGPVSEERPLTEHRNDLVHHPLFPACHLNRPSICMAGPRGKEEVDSMIYGWGQTPVGQAAQKLATSSILVQLIRQGSVFRFLDLPINTLLCGCPEALWWLTALTYSKTHRSAAQWALQVCAAVVLS